MQNLSVPLDTNLVMSEAVYDLNLNRPDQNSIHHVPLEGNGAANPFPVGSVSPESGTTINLTSPSSDDSMQEIRRSKVNAGNCASVVTPYRRHGTRKLTLE